MVKQWIRKSILLRKSFLQLKKIQIALMDEKKWAAKVYKKNTGYDIDLENPKTLNEKIVWLKVNYFQEHSVQCCDKYLIHGYLKEKLGYDYAPELLYVTRSPKDLSMNKIRKFPCIIKVSNGSGSNLIVKDRDSYTDAWLKKYFRRQVISSNLHTVISREHQYFEKNPYIVVEELLQDAHGRIPDDYKFLYINGELQFIYCSVDRLNANVRQIYDPDWNRLHFIWVRDADKKTYDRYEASASIPKPENYEEMLRLSAELAQDFPLVRIDFYNLAGKLYIGEITLYHGSGNDRFYPEKYDRLYGEKLKLPKADRS